jgi:NAD(P)-dependent dehydrogenase (short-subunit alcohol dehydrogenase family)
MTERGGLNQRAGRLAGKVAVVTGAGSGIGQAAARAFVAEGALVGLLDINERVIAEMAAELGDAAYPLPCSVADEGGVAAAFAEVKRRYGRLDVLATYAAVQLIGEDAPVHELPLEVWQRTHDVNLKGVYLCCKHGVRLMIDAGNGGSVINCGSPTGLTMCGAGWHAYSSSKAGVMALTRIMAADYAKHGIRVNGIVPGTIETNLVRQLTDDPVQREYLAGLHPIGRIGTPADMVGIAVFLASDESAFATGAHFFVDGGISVR